MATYHLSVKVGKAGKGAAHAAYIARVGNYAHLLASPKAEVLECCEHGNMPAWAQADPLQFWTEADQRERKNGAIYREFELALPNELTPAQARDLVREFVAQEIGDKHAYTFAIHNGTAALDGVQNNRNAHIMFSERTLDGIERGPDLFFKRANKKNPELGGCVKGNVAATAAERKAALVDLRERFADLTNAHLERHGHSDRVTHLSLKDQGIERPAERHLGPKRVRRLDEGEIDDLLSRRAAEGALRRAQAAVSTIDISGSLADALNERERRRHERAAFERIGKNLDAADRAFAGAGRNQLDHRAVARSVAAAAENQHARRTGEAVAAVGQQLGRLAPAIAGATRQLAQVVERRERDQRLTVEEIRAEIQRLTPPTVTDACNARRDFKQALHILFKYHDEHKGLEAAQADSDTAVAEWRAAHPVRAAMHDTGVVTSAALSRLVEAQRAAAERVAAAEKAVDEARSAQDAIYREEEQKLARKGAASSERIAELEALLASKTRTAPTDGEDARAAMKKAGIDLADDAPAAPSSSAKIGKPPKL